MTLAASSSRRPRRKRKLKKKTTNGWTWQRSNQHPSQSSVAVQALSCLPSWRRERRAAPEFRDCRPWDQIDRCVYRRCFAIRLTPDRSRSYIPRMLNTIHYCEVRGAEKGLLTSGKFFRIRAEMCGEITIMRAGRCLMCRVCYTISWQLRRLRFKGAVAMGRPRHACDGYRQEIVRFFVWK